jgi:hypothetical protein
MGQTNRQRSLVAIAVRGDGSRAPVRLPAPAGASIIAKLESLVLGLLALLSGSRREPGDWRS